MRVALGATALEGAKTNIPVLAAVLRNGEFAAGSYDTGFLAAQSIVATAALPAANASS